MKLTINKYLLMSYSIQRILLNQYLEEISAAMFVADPVIHKRIMRKIPLFTIAKEWYNMRICSSTYKWIKMLIYTYEYIWILFYIWMLFKLKKDEDPTIYDKMDESQGHYAKWNWGHYANWNKPDKYILHVKETWTTAGQVSICNRQTLWWFAKTWLPGLHVLI